MGKVFVHIPTVPNTVLGKFKVSLDSRLLATFSTKGGDVEAQVDQDGLLEVKLGLMSKKIDVKADQYSVVCVMQAAIGLRATHTVCDMALVNSGKRIPAKGKVIITCGKFFLTTPSYKVFVDGTEVGSVTKDQNTLEVLIDETCEIVIKEKGLSLQKIIATASPDEVKMIRILPSNKYLFSSETILLKDGFKLSVPKPAENSNPSTLKKVGKTLLKHKKAIMLGAGVVAALTGLDADAADLDVDADVDLGDDLDFDTDDMEFEALDTDGDGFADTLLVDADGDGIADAAGIDTDGDGILDTFGADTDGDGAFDTFGTDIDGDGTLDTIGMDTDGDGAIDTVGLDTDGDGAIDTIGMDTDGDGAVDTIGMDTDGDGAIDTVGVDTDGNGALDQVNTISEEESLLERVDSIVEDTIDAVETDSQPVMAGAMAATAAAAAATTDARQTMNATNTAMDATNTAMEKKKPYKLLLFILLPLLLIGGVLAFLLSGGPKQEEKDSFITGFFSEYYSYETNRSELFEKSLSKDLLQTANADPELLGYLTDAPSDVLGTMTIIPQNKGSYLVSSEVYGQTSEYLVHVNKKLKIDQIEELQAVTLPASIATKFYAALLSHDTFVEKGELNLDIEPARYGVPVRKVTGSVTLPYFKMPVKGQISGNEISLDLDDRGLDSMTGRYADGTIDASGTIQDSQDPVTVRLIAAKDPDGWDDLLKRVQSPPEISEAESAALLAMAEHALLNLPDHSDFGRVDQDCYTTEFKDLLRRSFEKGAAEAVEGEIGDEEFLGYWYDGNGDGMDLDSRKFRITSYDGESATVHLHMTYYDFPEIDHDFAMLFKKEGGEWHLDDWVTSLLDVGMKARCKDYLGN